MDKKPGGAVGSIRWVGLTLATALLTLGIGGGGPLALSAGRQTPAVAGAPAQPQEPGRGGRQGGRGGAGRGGPQGGAPIAFDNHTGFRQIFNGTTLEEWDGDPTFWRVEAGTIVGESTPEKPVTQNTFLIWRGGTPGDFDLKLEFRIHAGNSGVQYRSEHLPEGGDGNIGRWVLKGYQADIDYNNQYTGMLYEERGRGFLAPRGQFNYAGATQPAAPGAPSASVRGQVAALDTNEALRDRIKQGDWNQFQVVARGNVVIHVLNGHLTALFVDDDAAARALQGLMGVQIHTGPPMKVEFRNIYIKTL